jgi:flagellar basal-body rod modification protein FlgD
MATSAMTGMTGAQPTMSSATSTDKKPGVMGKDDFLKLLTAQLRMQDPQAPNDINQTTQQMTQFSIVEQLMTLNDAMKGQQLATAQSQAMALLGKTVTWEAADGTTNTGLVEHVSVAGGTSMLHIGGQEVNPATVSSVS